MPLHNQPRGVICSLLLLAVLACSLFFISDSLAQDVAPYDIIKEDTNYSENNKFCPDEHDGIAGRVVRCIQNIVIQAAKNFMDAFFPYYEAILIAVLILSVTVYGVLVATGSISRFSVQTLIQAFKIGLVGFFAVKFGGMIDYVFDMLEGILGIVVHYVSVSASGACSDHGFVREIFDVARPNPDAWDMVDCLFITLLGMSVTSTVPIGITVIMSGMFFHGVGILIIALCLFFILTNCFAVVRAIYLYLMSIIALCFLICVSPLTIPMALFAATKPVFEEWLKYFINYLLVPIFVFAFLVMMVAAYDVILFKGKNSLFWAIAHEASQTEGFNFKDWAEKGVDGNGVPVGKDVPGIDAITIQNNIDQCNGPNKDLMGNICDANLQGMLDCALNPVIPNEGSDAPEDGDCSKVEGTPYYGFLRNEEVLHFALAPNVETDKAARMKKDEGCGWNIFCHGAKAVGWAFDQLKHVAGLALQGIGWIIDNVGGWIVEQIAHLVGGVCRLTPLPGSVCAFGEGMLMVAADIVHGAGKFVAFSGRVLINGLLSELKDLFMMWFDVITLDYHKVAAYQCKVEFGIADPKDPRYYKMGQEGGCPGVRDVLTKIIYVIMTAAILAYLMLQWLAYIPSLAREVLGKVVTEVTLPKEKSDAPGYRLAKWRSGLEERWAPKKGG